MASLAPFPSIPSTQTKRSPRTLSKFPPNPSSPPRNPACLPFNSLHSSTETPFPAAFSHTTSLESPVSADPLPWLERVFHGDPPWIPSFTVETPFAVTKPVSSTSEYNRLRRRQIKAETEAWDRAAEEYKELERVMLEKKLAPCLPYVKSLFLGWFEPFRDAIEEDQRVQRGKKHKAAYGGYIGLLPADKTAVIVMHKMMGLLMVGQEEGCVRVVQAAVHIGEALEQEFKIHNYLEKTRRSGKRSKQEDTTMILGKEEEIVRRRVLNLMRMKKLPEIHKIIKDKTEVESWGRDAQAKLASRLIELLIESAFVQPPPSQMADSTPEIRPAFRHTIRTIIKEDGRSRNRYGVIECDPIVHKGLDSTAGHMVIPYLPMLIPPKSWKGYDRGGHLFLPSYVMRTHGAKEQQDAIRSVPRKKLQKVYKLYIGDVMPFT